jgi:SAM-dependent methyltransferase
MRAEPEGLHGFYASRQGQVAARLIGARLAALWPDLRGRAVLGLGHPMPLLEPWRASAGTERCIGVVPAQLGAARWPPGRPGLCCAAEENSLPFPDLCFDRVLLVHALEAAENPRRLLREVWRVLRDDGRLLVVAANRRGLWAHVETTPFAHGRPFSAGQLARLLSASLFRPARRDCALFMPPWPTAPVLRGADVVERVGRALLPELGGVAIREACKDVLAALPAESAALGRRAPGRRRVLVVDGA